MASLIPDIIVQVVATVSGVIISVGVPLILSKINKMGKVYTTVFGIDDVESMSGLVGVVEDHDGEIQEIKENQEEMRDNQSDIQSRIADLQKSISERNKGND